ncbi:MAG: B12-binding domain-containing radical SAM protein [Geobacteraceae bacterium GWC2_58_44]|nr:MAG: B12-binding domain-containing radical SAM protein [Geobacteraceae bacterium GWC2_58_44]HBG06984.1 B12-binding domain-containing radical SAM protein [Geobacter sp.]
MRILLINPPNCGKSIPEERYGIDSIRQIFRGEPLALEVLAGNLTGHELRILDLKAEPDTLQQALGEFRPELAVFTAVTCEANTVLRLAAEVKESCGARVVAGGIHASCDPEFFNKPGVDYVVVGLGKGSLAELAAAIEAGEPTGAIAGIAATRPGERLAFAPRLFGAADLAEQAAPRYDLVAGYRDNYTLSSVGSQLGLVVSAFGCPYSCSFCCIGSQTGGRYLTQSIGSVLRDIRLLGEVPVIRLVDANTFGNIGHARLLAESIVAAGIKKHFIADVRSDTVVRYPSLMRQWKEAGLRSVVIGFEEIADGDLFWLNKESSVAVNDEAIGILHDLGITIVGDFIVSPDYDEARFDALERYVTGRRIELPILTVLTPLPGTPLYAEMEERITIRDLDYYTLTNAVMPTRLGEERFYRQYARLMKSFHASAKL